MALPIKPLDRPCLFLDTESGGLDPATHSLLSVGLVVGDRGVVRHSLELFLKAGPYVVQGEAMRVNRIDLASHHHRAMDESTAMAVLDVFLDQYFPCKHTPIHLAGHNVAQDRAFLARFWSRCGRGFEPRFSHRSIDTHAMAWALRDAGRLDLEDLGSSSLFRHFSIQIPEEKRHTALGDALGTFELYWKLIGLMENRS